MWIVFDTYPKIAVPAKVGPKFLECLAEAVMLDESYNSATSSMDYSVSLGNGAKSFKLVDDEKITAAIVAAKLIGDK